MTTKPILCRIALLFALLLLVFSPAARTAEIGPAQRQAIEDVVRDYLLEHPEVIDDALKALQVKREAEGTAKRLDALESLRSDIENDPDAPVAGDPRGEVTIVEFFDYQCEFCKRVLPSLQAIVETEPKVRIVFREFPILGQGSVFAARVSLAAWAIDRERHFAFHTALMKTKGPLNESAVWAVASANGLDVRRLKTAIADPRIETMIRKNYDLAESLGITGTPAFVIGDHFVPGAVDLGTLRRLLAEARSSSARR